MKFESIDPGPRLRPHVEAIWHFEGTFLHDKEIILPDGKMQLLVNLHRDELVCYDDRSGAAAKISGAGLSGAYAKPFRIDTLAQRAVLGVSFAPGGAWALFDDPASAIAGHHVELAQLWGAEGQALRERLLEQNTPTAQLRVVRELLERRLVGAADPATRFAIEALEGGARVSAVTDQLGMSARRFITTFSARVGLTPKKFARVRRFQRLIDAVDLNAKPDWAGLAAEHGYFDQAHLTHDFRRLSGMRPGDYHPRSATDRNHVPVPIRGSAISYNP